MAFYVGQRVQCVDAGGCPELTDGQVYAVREVYARGLNVVGVVALPIQLYRGFHFWRFRPLAEPKTDISIFRKALTGDFVDA